MKVTEIARECAFEMISSSDERRKFCSVFSFSHDGEDRPIRAVMKMLIKVEHSGLEVLEWLYFCPECASKLRKRRAA